MSRALVTGAGKRLGRAMASYLGGRGYDVAVHYGRSAAGAEACASELRSLGRAAVTLQADLLEPGAAEELLPRAAQALGGPITCLVNNASIFEHDVVESVTRDSWDRNMDSNLRVPFILTQAMAAQGLVGAQDENGEAQAAGLIVNMIDQRVRKLTPDYTSYTIAKCALWAMTQTTAQALAPHLRVNAIAPGPTLRAAEQSGEGFAHQRASTVLKRGSNPNDISAALGYLIDARAVTGQMICVDGGQHLGWKTPDVTGLL